MYTRTGDVTATIKLPEGKMVLPGEDATFNVELVSDIALEVSQIAVGLNRG